MILLIKFLIVPFQLGNSENCHRSFSISEPFSRINQFPGSNRIVIEEKDICRRAKYRFCFHESSKWFFLLNFSIVSVVNSENCHRNVLDFCAHFHKRINFRVQVQSKRRIFAKERNTDSISLRIGAHEKKMALVSWRVRVETLLGDVASFGFKLDPLDTSKTRSLNVLSSPYFSFLLPSLNWGRMSVVFKKDIYIYVKLNYFSTSRKSYNWFPIFL